jgi:hypothetical protein
MTGLRTGDQTDFAMGDKFFLCAGYAGGRAFGGFSNGLRTGSTGLGPVFFFRLPFHRFTPP